MITRALYNKFHKLATMARFSTGDAEELQAAIQKYINPKYSVCLRCAQQLRHGQKIIINWLDTVEVIEDIEPVVEESVLEMAELPEPDIDLTEADKVGCTKCKKKKTNKS